MQWHNFLCFFLNSFCCFSCSLVETPKGVDDFRMSYSPLLTARVTQTLLLWQKQVWHPYRGPSSAVGSWAFSLFVKKEVNLTETPELVECIYESWTPFKQQAWRCALLMTWHTVRSFVSASSCFPPSISLHCCPPGLSIHCLYHCMASFILLHFHSLPACLTKTTNASLLTLTVYLSFCSHTMIAGIQSIFSRGSQHTEP